jgi:membrane protease YdiL (CAAX protease family)
MTQPVVRAPSGARQFWTLARLWWLYIRRRPTRSGETPRLSGVPTFLLISAIGTGYMMLITWQTVARNVERHPGTFVWYAFGVMLLGFSQGLAKAGGKSQLAGTRDDAFLEALPLRTLARLGLRLTDTITLLPLALVGPMAAVATRESLGGSWILPALLGGACFLSCFIAGCAVITWIRALGPVAAARWGRYLGVAASFAAMLLLFTPVGMFWSAHTKPHGLWLALAWIGPAPRLLELFAVSGALTASAYAALAAAERFGHDQLDPQIRAPKASRRFRDRFALERAMLQRQGGLALYVMYALLSCAALWVLVLRPPPWLSTQPQLLLFAASFVVYMAAIQTIGQAGRAARADRQARWFLAALPMSPFQVLDGKTRALRVLASPALFLLALVALSSVLYAGSAHVYRIALASIALFVVVDGAVSIAFLSTGIGVVGLGGVQTTGFSTQILLLPLLTIVLAPNDWAATIALIAVVAVTFESHRAARTSVRWIDDPADDVERETTVWRALLAASAFYAVQALTFQILNVFELAMGYALAIAFAASAVLLALLTWRNDARFQRPRFLPTRAWFWPVGLAAGVASGLLAREFARRIPAALEASPDLSRGELVALAITTTVVAPLVEEYFFRGWLQRAVEADLPARLKPWGFVLGAIAFALAHLGTYGVPQLVLGLAAGWLFARGAGLGPSMLAHALHNGVVLALGL